MSYNQTQLRALSILGFILTLVPLSIYVLWVNAFNQGSSQSERVAIFNDYFPDFLHGRWDTTLLGMAFCVLAIILGITALKLKAKSWKAFNLFILSLSSLLFALNLFSMM